MTQPVESDDEFEDLDQLESEDDEPLSATQKARLPKGPTSGALKPPRGMQMNTKEIHRECTCNLCFSLDDRTDKPLFPAWRVELIGSALPPGIPRLEPRIPT